MAQTSNLVGEETKYNYKLKNQNVVMVVLWGTNLFYSLVKKIYLWAYGLKVG